MNRRNVRYQSRGVFKGVLFFLCFCLLSTTSLVAAPFRTTVTSYGNIPAVLNSSIDTLLRNLDTEVNSKLPDISSGSAYLKGMSDSGVIAVKGIGVDYASAPDIFVVGAGVGVGADIGGASLSDVMNGTVDAKQLRGFGAATSVMGGVNLNIFKLPTILGIDPNKLTLFMNFWSMDVPSLSGGLKGDLKSFGFHAMYRVIDGIQIPFFVRWGGIYLTTGFDTSRMNLTFSQELDKSATASITYAPLNNPTVNARFLGTATAGADVKISTIPIELSTHVQLLHFLTFFGGLAADINSGKADAKANLRGSVSVTDTQSVLSGISAASTLDLGVSGKPTSMNGRWFFGTQFNITLLKLYAQLNHGIGQDTWGVNAGVRVAY